MAPPMRISALQKSMLVRSRAPKISTQAHIGWREREKEEQLRLRLGGGEKERERGREGERRGERERLLARFLD